MSSTGSNLVTNSQAQYVPQAFSPVDNAYKALGASEVGSSDFAADTMPWVKSGSTSYVARAGDTGGRAGSYIIGETTTVSLTVSTSTDGLSGAVDLGGYRIAAIDMSTAWTTADLTFAAASSSGGTYKSLYDDDHFEVIIRNPGGNEMITIRSEAEAIAPLRHVKLRSGTASDPVAQAATRTLTLILKG